MSVSPYLNLLLMLPTDVQAEETELATLFPVLTWEMYVPMLEREMKKYRGGQRLYEHVRLVTIAAYLNLNGQENPRAFFWAVNNGLHVSNMVRDKAFRDESKRRIYLAETCNVMFPEQRSGDHNRNTWNQLEYCLQKNVKVVMKNFIKVGYNTQAAPLNPGWEEDAAKLTAQAMWERICEHASAETMASIELPDLFTLG